MLSWDNPVGHNFAGVRVLRKLNAYSFNDSDGLNIYENTGKYFIDTSLSNGTKYFYTAFVYYTDGNASSGATSDTTPLANALNLPVSAPTGGSYNSSPQNVTLSSATAPVKICYRTDGATPQCDATPNCVNSLEYVGAISVANDLTLKAIACKAGHDPSPLWTASYVFDTTPPGAPTSFTATQAGPNQIALAWTAATDNRPQSEIVYQICQSTSAGGCNVFSATYTTSAGATAYAVTGLNALTTYYFKIRARDKATNTGTASSEQSAVTESLGLVNDAILTPTPGSYAIAQNVTMASPTAAVTICYTTDGATPACNATPACTSGSLYTGAISVGSTAAVKTIACKAGFTPSAVTTGIYSFDNTPPGAVTAFGATAGDAQVNLVWMNPGDVDFTGVRVVRKTGSYSAAYTDGTSIYSGTGTAALDTGLINGTQYFYTAYAYDAAGNYASGVQATATPSGGTVSAPTFSPTPGFFLAGPSVTLATTTGSATICYTTTGVAPNCDAAATCTSGNTYFSAVAIGATTNLQALACKVGFANSGITSGTYTLDTTPPGNVTALGATPGNTQVSLAWTNPADGDFAGVKVLRKTGSYPANNADGTLVYSGTGTAATDTSLTNGTQYYYTVFAYDTTGNYASGTQATTTPVTPTVNTPTFSPVAGIYGAAQNVTISTTTGSAILCYTTDGNTPACNATPTCTTGSQYSTAVAIAATATLRAIGCRVGYNTSGVASGVYTINLPPPVITNAETLDTNHNGKIDTYRLTFDKNVNDSTFPGYAANALGSVTTQWLIAGHTNVRLIHGTAVAFATDTANDTVIYVRFDEVAAACSAVAQTGCNTDSKPDLTTTASPGLQDMATTTMAQVNTGAVTEADAAPPVVVRAVALAPTSVDVTFSEPITATQANVAGNYTMTGGLSVGGAARDGSSFQLVHLTTSTQTGGTPYTLTVNTTLRDLANVNLITSTNPTSGLPANQAQFTGVDRPVVSSIVTKSATTLLITINEAVTEASSTCANQTACALIYSNTTLPVLSAVAANSSGTPTPGNSQYFLLTVNPMLEGQSYTTTVLQNTMTSVATAQQMGNTNNSATFNGDGKPLASVVMADTTTECPVPTAAPSTPSQTRVVVQYDQALSGTALTLTNYKIALCITGDCASGTGAPNSAQAQAVTHKGGNKYWVDFSASQPFDTDTSQYQLTITGVQDANGNTIASPANMAFRCGSDVTKPTLIAAGIASAGAGSTAVMLTFSESVDSTTANTASNYKYDTQSYGTNVLSAARQANTAQVLVTLQPALANGGHNIRVRNVTDLGAGNIIDDDGVGNIQPVIVNAPTGFSGGAIFDNHFGDGSPSGEIVVYDQKVYIGPNLASSKIFEMQAGFSSAQPITVDGDGVPGSPTSFNGLTTLYTGCATGFSNPPIGGDQCSPQYAVQSISNFYAACIGGSSTPNLTGTACATASGTEYLLIGAAKTDGISNLFYRSFWLSADKSISNSIFTFNERYIGDTGGTVSSRAMSLIVFKDQLFTNLSGDSGGGGRGGRVCINPSGCPGATNFTYLSSVSLTNIMRMKRIGAHASNSLRNGSYASGPYADASLGNQASNAITSIYEYDNDGASSNDSQLYLANGGYSNSTLGSARTGNSDGGIMRTVLAYSSKTSLPPDCPLDSSGCTTYYEDVTPDSLTKWNSYYSIPLPQNSLVTGAGNCGTSFVEMDCSVPYNVFTPGMKAIPYMRTASNGDLYLLRNACTTNGYATNGGAPDFRTLRQVCPSGSEVTQIWMMPKNCGTAASCASAWQLVAENSTTGKSNMAGNTASCGTSPNKCLQNTHITLLEVVGNYLYIGYDNSTYGANIWRTDLGSVSSGAVPSQSAFSLVNAIGLDSTATNQRIFNHVTVNSGGRDWLIVVTGDGSNAAKIYRTANDEN